MAAKLADFSGYATKADLKCSDGRTITPAAFKEQDGQTVPLVWQHQHDGPGNVLGHAVLEARPDGMYAHCYFNESPKAQEAKYAVKHKDITRMSIYANQLVEKAKAVLHGKIREVSLVLAGANPGAIIDNVSFQHSDGEIDTLEDEAFIHTGLELELSHDDTSSQGDVLDLQHIWDSLSDVQKAGVEYMVGAASEAALATVQHSDGDDNGETDDNAEGVDNDEDGSTTGDEGDPKDVPEGKTNADSNPPSNTDEDTLDHQEGTEMGHSIFDKDSKKGAETYELTHSDITGIFEKAKQLGSVKDAVEDFALKHGIDNIETLFPDAQSVTNTPDLLARRTEWVASVLNGTRHTPFSRIKSRMADLTLDEARAKGFVKGAMKREEFFGVSKRITTPQTIYKKQKLDRDDILDITDFDVVVWLKAELRLMLEEELARAVLIGDGRSAGDEDKIKDPAGSGDAAGIRSIANDHELYATTVYVNVDDADSTWEEVVDALVLQRRHYRGSGNPTFFTTEDALARMLLIKDTVGRRIYPTAADLAAAIRVNTIIAVEVMDQEAGLIGIMVNLQDYTIGADRGGDLTMFDNFDIDYNQYKYLLETRVSGALTKPKSALVVRKAAGAAVLADPTAPSFDGTTVTIPNDANATYTRTDTGATLAGGATVTLADGEKVTIDAAPSGSGVFFSTNSNEWTFENER